MQLLNKIVSFRGDAKELDWHAMWKQMKWMIKFGKGYVGRIGFLTGLSIFFTLLGVAYAAIYKNVVDLVLAQFKNILAFVQAQAQSAISAGFWYTVNAVLKMLPDWILWVVVGYVFYRIFNFLFGIFMQFFTLRLSMDLGLGIKRKVFTAILESDWMSLTQYHSGDLVNRILSDSSTISSFVLDQVPAVIVQCIQFIAAFSLLTYYDWSLTIVALVGIPLYLFVIKLKGKRLRDYNMRAQEITSKNMSFLSESMTNIMVIKSFTLVPEFIRRYRKVHDEMYDWTMEKTRYGIVTGVITGTLSKMLGYVITAFILYRVITGSLSIGMLAAFGILMGQVSGPVSSMISFVMSSIEVSASAERVMKIFELPRDRTQVPAEVEQFAKKAADDGMGLQIRKLDFAYEPDKYVLKDVNIDVRPGETVAFVGPSGEGKTTLIRLALGLLLPNEGTAEMVTGKNETLPLSVETRAFFSYVPQGNTMFSGTIYDNMLLGNPQATREQITEALEQACAWKFIQDMPEQLDTKIGERGVGISEGQAQRLAIARALLRGAPILLLDEATSALDVYTEKEVLDNIFHSGLCQTCILTTHRPSVFTVCDKIYRVRNRSVELIKASRDQEATF